MYTIEHIIELGESNNYISAFKEYEKLFSFSEDFELWKHYYPAREEAYFEINY